MLKNASEFWSIRDLFSETIYIFFSYDKACNFLGDIGTSYLEQNPGKDLPPILHHPKYVEHKDNWVGVVGWKLIKWINPATLRP